MMMRDVIVVAICTLGVAACGPSSREADAGGGGPDAVERCDPGASRPCYTGATGTENVGPCHGGTQACAAEGIWGACEGEVKPSSEVCGNGADENCSGQADEEVDLDGDG